MRYNKIFAGPVTALAPQVTEAPAAASLKPGSVVTLNSAGKLAAAVAATRAVLFLQDNYLTMEGVDDAIAADQRAVGLRPLPDLLFHLRVADGQDITKGDELSVNADGVLVKAASTNYVVAIAQETYNNDTGADELILVQPSSGYLKP